jgi:hypothetical protein
MRDLPHVPAGNGSSAGKRRIPLTEPRRIESPPAPWGPRDPALHTKGASRKPVGKISIKQGPQDHTSTQATPRGAASLKRNCYHES